MGSISPKQGVNITEISTVSVILQGYLSVSELSELIANISTDIREDGILDSQTLGSILINNASAINLETIRTNLESRYENLGLNITVPDFEKYVNRFKDNTHFEFTDSIRYPETGNYGFNILDKTRANYTPGSDGLYQCSMKAILPNGANLKVKLSGQNWSYAGSSDFNIGWNLSDYNALDNSHIFTATQTGEIDFMVAFERYPSDWGRKYELIVYENNDIEPTWTKEFTVKL